MTKAELQALAARCKAATGLVEEVERLRAKLAEYDKPECICPKCGIRHGGSFVRGEF